ncbi:unnamed protein product [Parnassius apollo]|uniref:(apollo) hypothetical protein n=1 Tax=Parnassius apollo TaxID=110799 RepID=A0A8S3WWI7_PARAO|nr:unnamed protein product [Parnassius apollo]
MSILPIIYLSFLVTSGSFAAAFKNTGGKDNVHQEIMTIHNGDDIVGVSSVAGVTSMNGKVSSVGGVKFFPAPGKGGGKNRDTFTFAYPINGNKGMAEGSISMNPGSVVVSSSSYNTKIPERNTWHQLHPMFDPLMHWPTINDFIFPHHFDFDSTFIDPWFPKTMIDRNVPTKSVLRMYPNFNPFLNLWR